MPRFGKAFIRPGLPADPLLRLLTVNGLAGLAVAALVLAGIFLTNIGNLRNLVLNSAEPVIPVILLACGLAVTLGSVVIGSAIMLLGEGRRGGGTPRKVSHLFTRRQLRPVPVKATRGTGKHPAH